MFAINIENQRFGRLLVIARAGSSKGREALFKCRCDCGKEVIVVGKSLRRGLTKSCGCLQREIAKKANTKHGLGNYENRIYRIWRGMRTRCLNPNASHYKIYGGRGISVCSEWLHEVKLFYEWAVSHGYKDNLTIDRIDNDKGYEPSNCRWATYKEQRHNQRAKGGVVVGNRDRGAGSIQTGI